MYIKILFTLALIMQVKMMFASSDPLLDLWVGIYTWSVDKAVTIMGSPLGDWVKLFIALTLLIAILGFFLYKKYH